MTFPTLNVAALERVYAHIVANPEEWNQRYWHCGTSMCFAGHTVAMYGTANWSAPGDPGCDTFVALSTDDEDDLFIDEGERVIYVADRARHILGITEDEAAVLFHQNNTLADIRRIIDDLIAGARH
ncbi:hypothetical protein AB0D67_36235 [Streptosporangium sp. NPDC048047]|uniref:hypothetical protein n=1 Tax=Streptosporangium sp. NPDC048047 TaxID=3155748 RepID=UPI0034307E8F